MEKQIVKIDPDLKGKLLHLIGCKWNEVRIVLFEDKGIRVYHNEYGTATFVKYEQITNL